MTAQGSVSYLPSDWIRVQRLGLCDGVTTPEEYALKASVGFGQAIKFLEEYGEAVPSLDVIKLLHEYAFIEVHPWAGKFRRAGQEVQAGKLICVAAIDISKELTHLTEEMRANPLKGDAEYLSEVIGYYHAAFIAIHPFRDGNGRIGRLILNHQCKKLLGMQLSSNYLREDYISCLEDATSSGKLTRLGRFIRSQCQPLLQEVPKTEQEKIKQEDMSFRRKLR